MKYNTNLPPMVFNSVKICQLEQWAYPIPKIMADNLLFFISDNINPGP